MSTTKTLVNELEKAHLSPPVRRAFLTVDRAIFVPEYFAHVGKEWRAQTTNGEVYQDRALVTKMDEAGIPCSSSSQPSVMAAMLEGLQLQPGQNVLEIGAGTGYNAALLATIVGEEGYVISIEIDEELAQQARQRLAKLGIHNVEVVVGDGAKGYSKAAPYDRIIAAAGFRQIPQAWKDQLTTGGIIVGNLLRACTEIR